jgi:glycine betaine catabolism B
MIKLQAVKLNPPIETKTVNLFPEQVFREECLIGSSPNCHVVLADPDVSGIHGKIFCQGQKYYFADLASSRGSYINDAPAQLNQSYGLNIGDMIRVGSSILLVETLMFGGMRAAELPQPQRDGKRLSRSTVTENADIPEWKGGELSVRCDRIIAETSDVKTFCFVANPPVRFNYEPGQFVTLALEIAGETVYRCYSISSTPSRPDCLEITVKRVASPVDSPEAPAGLVSNWLHDQVTIGTEVTLTGPTGKFTCINSPSQKLLLMSAGSGITPIMSMARWICDGGADYDVVFCHTARTTQDVIFYRELLQMAAEHSNFHLAITLTQPDTHWKGLTGRLNATRLQMIAPDLLEERSVYVCGSEGFMNGTKAMLETSKFPMERYFEESFGGVPQRAKQSSPSIRNATNIAASNAVSSTHFGLSAILNGLSAPSSESVSLANPIAPSRETGRMVLDRLDISARPAPPESITTHPSHVVFAQMQQDVVGDGDETILEMAERSNIKLRSGCRTGVCGACTIAKLEGEVRYEGATTGLSAQDKAAGCILACVAYAEGRVVVDV